MNNLNGYGWRDGLCDSGAHVRKDESSVYPPGKFGPAPKAFPVLPCDRAPFRCPHKGGCKSNPFNCPGVQEEKI